MNKLHAERNAHRKNAKNALAKAERELDRLVQAIMDGVPASRVKDRMIELEGRKTELEAQLAEGENEAILVHPKMAGFYREQAGQLREALTDERRRAEATGLIRKLVDKIVLSPVTHEGRKTALYRPARAARRYPLHGRKRKEAAHGERLRCGVCKIGYGGTQPPKPAIRCTVALLVPICKLSGR